MPQRRKRVFIVGYKKGTKMYKKILNNSNEDFINNDSLFSSSFPICKVENKEIISNKLSSDLVDITNNFNSGLENDIFLESGFMINNNYFTFKPKSNYKGSKVVLKDILQPEESVPEEFYISLEDISKWEYQKGSKSFDRINKTTGHTYKYSEGSMSFPDSLDKPSRTIITGEGGSSASRFKHVIYINGKYRRLTPLELERLNMFPDNHTIGLPDVKRAFLMGNALVVGIVKELSKNLIDKI